MLVIKELCKVGPIVIITNKEPKVELTFTPLPLGYKRIFTLLDEGYWMELKSPSIAWDKNGIPQLVVVRDMKDTLTFGVEVDENST